MLAGQGPEREQPFLHRLQGAPVEVDPGARLFHEGRALGDLRRGALEGGDGRVQASAGLFRHPLQVPERAPERGLDAGAFAEHLRRLVHRLEQFFRVHHHRPLAGQRRLLIGFGIEGRQFPGGVAQEVLLCPRRLPRRRGPGPGLAGPAPVPAGPSDARHEGFQVPVGIQQGAVVGRVEEALALELPVHFGQAFGEAPQQRHAHRLVVDEGPRAAVGAKHPAQEQGPVGAVDAVFFQEFTGGMAGGHGELRRDHGLLGAVADEAAVGAHAERQSQGVQQNGFPGPRFAGEHAQTKMEGKVQAAYEDDVADRQSAQHPTRPATRTCTTVPSPSPRAPFPP